MKPVHRDWLLLLSDYRRNDRKARVIRKNWESELQLAAGRVTGARSEGYASSRMTGDVLQLLEAATLPARDRRACIIRNDRECELQLLDPAVVAGASIGS